MARRWGTAKYKLRRLRDQKGSKDWLEYKRRNKKRNHIESLVKSSTNTNTKPVWDALNISKPNSKEIDIKLSYDALNDRFVSIAKLLTSHLQRPPRVHGKITLKLLSCVPEFTHLDLIAYLKDVPSSKATGVDIITQEKNPDKTKILNLELWFRIQ